MYTSYPAVRRMAAATIVCSSCWFSSFTSSASERLASRLTALESITAAELRRHVEYLADDALEGRQPGTPGGRQAGDYLRAQLEERGIRGGGVDGGYFQPFEPSARNVLGFIEGSDPELKREVVLVGAHYDHVGYGNKENSAGPIGQIHNGADDNASGTAAVLELADAIAQLPSPPKRSILLAFWDAEEAGMLGAKHWVANPTVALENVVAAINLDMVGRLRDNLLTVYGSRSGYGLRRLVGEQNEFAGLKIDFSWEFEDDADHYALFQGGIPVLFLHTGVHDQWHSPRDDAELIDGQGISRVTQLAFDLLYELADNPERHRLRPEAGAETESLRKQLAGHKAKLPDRLGAAWRRQADSRHGVRISRIASRSPAARAKIRPGDRIVQFAGHEIRNSEQLTSVVMLAGHEAPVVVRRPRRAEPLNLTVELDGNPMRLGITWRTDEAEPGTVILTHVVPGSPAAEAGMQVGDRIYRVAGRDFADEAALLELVKTTDDLLTFLVERDGQLRTVVVQLPVDASRRAA